MISTPVQHEPQVDREIKRNYNLLEDLTVVVDELVKRLEPVTIVSPREGDNSDGLERILCPLANTISKQNDSLFTQTERLRTILREIQI